MTIFADFESFAVSSARQALTPAVIGAGPIGLEAMSFVRFVGVSQATIGCWNCFFQTKKKKKANRFVLHTRAPGLLVWKVHACDHKKTFQNSSDFRASKKIRKKIEDFQ